MCGNGCCAGAFPRNCVRYLRTPRCCPRFDCYCRQPNSAPVAQLDRASPSGGEGLGFESLRARHLLFVWNFGGIVIQAMKSMIAACRCASVPAQSGPMISHSLNSICRAASGAVLAAALAGCASGASDSGDGMVDSHVSVVTGFRLDVTVVEETLKKKRIRARAETEITSVRRRVPTNAAGQCDAPVRASDVVSRTREATPGRMALTGPGASLDQNGVQGTVMARPRVYFLGRMDDADDAARHDLGDFIDTATDHPAIAGAEFLTFRLAVVATPAGEPRDTEACVPDLGASRRYTGEGERRAFAWHGVDFSGVPERYFARVLQDADDVTIAVMDAVTRVPIQNARVEIGNLDGAFMDYAHVGRRYLTGIEDAFIRDLYASFADSDFFAFTEMQSSYSPGDILRVRREPQSQLSIKAAASGYKAVSGSATVGGGRTAIQIFMVPEDGGGATSMKPGIQVR